MNAVSAYLTTLVFVAQTRLGKATKGATAVEYGLLVALIAAETGLGDELFGANLSAQFAKIGSQIAVKP